VTSLKFLGFLKGELETPHVVSYFFYEPLAFGLPFVQTFLVGFGNAGEMK